MTWKEGRQTPDTALMRFVAHHFPSRATFLDVGSGEGANARELRDRGYEVDTVDINPQSGAEYIGDIRLFDPAYCFNLVYDINTLCHVEDPPFEKIKSWLKPEGYFFSICPTHLAPAYIAYGKECTRRVSEHELRVMLEPFFLRVTIGHRSEPDMKGNQLESWIVVARP